MLLASSCYSNAAKSELLGVPPELIAQHGAVSEPVARSMAHGAVQQAPVQVSVAVTGIAGPTGGSADKPVGTVWFGWSVDGVVSTECCVFHGDRAAVREATVLHALQGLLERQRLSVAEIDYFEINEAFAVVNLHAERELGLPRDRTNLYGGGISIGHPPGATGLRMTMTAMHHLQDSGGRYAVMALCIGAGQGMALLIENLLR